MDNINTNNILNEADNIIFVDEEEYGDDFDLIEINIEDKLNKEKNEIMDLLKEDYKDDYDIERAKRPFEFKNHSPTLASKSTSSSIKEENEKINFSKMRLSYNCQAKTLLPNIKEITPFFSDVFESQGITIVKKNNIITQMTFNLFLKKIVIGNFIQENMEYIINFSEQCFYFLKREIVFKKIIDCYRHYTEIKVPFDQRKKLIDLMSLLIIKLYNVFTKIVQNEEIIAIIKPFYQERIKELKTLNHLNKKPNLIQEIVKDGINDINYNIKKLINNDTDGNKDKDIKHIKNNNIDINENLNNMINERKKINETKNQNNYLLKEEKLNKEIEKEEKNKKEKEKEKMNSQEQTLLDCESILNLIKDETPNQEILTQIEKSLNIYKLQKNSHIEKENTNSRKVEKKLIKSHTQSHLKVLKLEDNKSKTKFSQNKKLKKLYFSSFNYEIKEIGEQLINVSLRALNKINRKELYNGAFLKKSKLMTSPNVMENISKFNRLISFIIEDILSYDFPQDRAKIIERWVYIAEYLKTRKDYNDILAINSALKNYVITGLNLTWNELNNKTKKMIRELDQFCSFNKNYKNFREDINSLKENDFYVPYLGMLLKDLNFYEENYKYIVNGNMINFEKINKVQKTLDEFFRFKNIKDKHNKNLNVELNFLDNLDDKNEIYLENIASKLEPKFTLYKNPKKIKRLTYVDKTFFRGYLKKGSLTQFIKQNDQ